MDFEQWWDEYEFEVVFPSLAKPSRKECARAAWDDGRKYLVADLNESIRRNGPLTKVALLGDKNDS